MSRALILLPFLSLIIVCLPAFSAQNSIVGDWVGVIKVDRKSQPVRIRFSVKDPTMTGKLTMPTQRIFDMPLNQIHWESNQLRFELQTGAEVQKFNGYLSGDTISGTVTQAHGESTFQIAHLAPIEPQKYFGAYELEPGKFIYIRTWDELGENQLAYFDDSGRVGPLFGLSETSFFSGPGIWIPFPVQVKITFTRNEKREVDGLIWAEGGMPEKSAKRVAAFKEEEIFFENDQVRLSGTLVVPAGQGPHPAVVLVHGSGPVTRDFFGPIAYLFARRGIAVLSYDKRGIGKSGGHWLDAGF